MTTIQKLTECAEQAKVNAAMAEIASEDVTITPAQCVFETVTDCWAYLTSTDDFHDCVISSHMTTDDCFFLGIVLNTMLRREKLCTEVNNQLPVVLMSHRLGTKVQFCVRRVKGNKAALYMFFGQHGEIRLGTLTRKCHVGKRTSKGGYYSVYPQHLDDTDAYKQLCYGLCQY